MGHDDKLEALFKKSMRRLQAIHFVLAASMVLLGFVAYGLQKSPLADFPAGGELFVYLVPIAALVGYFGGLYIFRKLLLSLNENQETATKLSRLQTAFLLQYSCLETPAVIALIAYIQQGYLLYAAIAVSLIIYQITRRPGFAQLPKLLPMTKEEQDVISKLS